METLISANIVRFPRRSIGSDKYCYRLFKSLGIKIWRSTRADTLKSSDLIIMHLFRDIRTFIRTRPMLKSKNLVRTVRNSYVTMRIYPLSANKQITCRKFIIVVHPTSSCHPLMNSPSLQDVSSILCRTYPALRIQVGIFTPSPKRAKLENIILYLLIFCTVVRVIR